MADEPFQPPSDKAPAPEPVCKDCGAAGTRTKPVDPKLPAYCSACGFDYDHEVPVDDEPAEAEPSAPDDSLDYIIKCLQGFQRTDYKSRQLVQEALRVAIQLANAAPRTPETAEPSAPDPVHGPACPHCGVTQYALLTAAKWQESLGFYSGADAFRAAAGKAEPAPTRDILQERIDAAIAASEHGSASDAIQDMLAILRG